MFRRLMDSKGGWIILSLIAIFVFVGVNVEAGRIVGMRADLTQDKLFSLSPGTRNILAKLEKPVELTLYYSDELGKTAPVYGNYSVRVKDMLRVIESTSDDKVTFTVKDPKPFSETEDKAVELGLQGIPVDESGAKVYFGLAAKSGDKEIVIPFFQLEREKFLEYDIASLIYNLGSEGKPVVAVFTSRPMFGDMQMQLRGLPAQPYAIIQQLQNHVEVKQMFALEDIWKEKPAVLMIVHPGNLTDEDYYNLDQFLLRGGKAMIFLDPYNETAATRRGQFPERVASNMDRLLNHWGLEMVEERVAGDRAYARMVNAGDDNNVIPAPFLTWMSIREDGFSQSDAVTSQISLLNMQSAGILRVKQESSLNFEPLVQTSPDSQEVATELLEGDKPQILKILENFKPGAKPLTLAARVSGTTTTMFPDGPPVAKEDEAEKTDEAAPSADTGGEEEKKEPDAGQATEERKSDAATGDADKQPSEKPAVKADVATRDTVPGDRTMTVAQAETGPATEAGKPAADTPSDAQPATDGGAAASGDNQPETATTEPASETKPAETKSEEKAEEEKPTAPPFIAESSTPMNVILVADADLLEDRFWVQNRNFFGQRMQVPFANNADFVVNAVENLAGGDDLIGLRSRGTTQRPFTKIAEIKLAADRKYRAEEQRLRRQLEEAEKKLAELEQRKEDGASDTTVDDAVKATKAQFVEEVLSTRKSLRQVNLSLREDIESLDWWLRFLNIALIPILVGILAIVLGLVRMRRRKQHGGTAAG